MNNEPMQPVPNAYPPQPIQPPVVEPTKKSHKLLWLLIAVLVLALGGGAAYWWLNRDDAPAINSFEECKAAGNPIMESFPEQCAANGRTFINEAQQAPDATNENNGLNTEATSGGGAFKITFHDGIGEVIKPLDTDAFFVMGTKQPKFDIGGEVKIKEQEAFGTDAPPILAMMVIKEGEYEEPLGTATDFTVSGNEAGDITGKKYTYVYEEDEPETIGIGVKRLKNDKSYTYILHVGGGKVLYVHYAVYGETTDNHEIVDKMLKTIRLL